MNCNIKMTTPLQLLSIERNPREPRQKKVSVIRELSGGEEIDLRKATRHLSEFETWDAIMRIVDANFRSVGVATEQAANEAGARALRGELGPLLNLTVNRALINLITSFTLYLDHTETRLKHRFGKASEEAKLFKNITASAFDRSFAYRFMCQLRDYGIHCGFPVTTASVTGQISHSGQPVHQLTCTFDPSSLLESGPTYWRGKVKADLTSCSGPFAIEPILTDAIKELHAINQALVEMEKPCLHASGRVVRDLVKEVFADNRVPAIGRVVEVEGGFDWELFHMPAQMMERLGYWRLEPQ